MFSGFFATRWGSTSVYGFFFLDQFYMVTA